MLQRGSIRTAEVKGIGHTTHTITVAERTRASKVYQRRQQDENTTITLLPTAAATDTHNDSVVSAAGKSSSVESAKIDRYIPIIVFGCVLVVIWLICCLLYCFGPCVCGICHRELDAETTRRLPLHSSKQVLSTSPSCTTSNPTSQNSSLNDPNSCSTDCNSLMDKISFVAFLENHGILRRLGDSQKVPSQGRDEITIPTRGLIVVKPQL